ncbi:hypothetical protein SAMN04488128_103213 [Chitinophaga eiseniae]|uniref:Uncharacterized protein n=1 Tax=Chitinophaga eiseniae TaxID=634771 RepID=A0A1T4SPD8_9BACT|nr:hypothetical protein [Chitinophaga eiseniae]SKA30052.1 hypothetical protein SAMN04488128_103213 [Chitinophaga eiseniae]
MIGQTFTISQNKVIRRLRVLSEFFQYGRRFYDVEDTSEPGVTTPFVADDFDKRFKSSGKVTGRRPFNGRYRKR